MRRGARSDGPAALRPPSEALTGNPAWAEQEPVEPVTADAGRTTIEQADVQRGADVPRHLHEGVATNDPGIGLPVDGEVENLHVSRRVHGADPVQGGEGARDPHVFRSPAGRRQQFQESREVGDLDTRILAEQQEVARRNRRCPESLEDAGVGDPGVPALRKCQQFHDLPAPGSCVTAHHCPRCDMNLPDPVSGWGQDWRWKRQDSIKAGPVPVPKKPLTVQRSRSSVSTSMPGDMCWDSLVTFSDRSSHARWPQPVTLFLILRICLVECRRGILDRTTLQQVLPKLHHVLGRRPCPIVLDIAGKLPYLIIPFHLLHQPCLEGHVGSSFPPVAQPASGFVVNDRLYHFH